MPDASADGLGKEQAGSAVPKVLVILPRPLLALFPGAVQQLTLQAATVKELMDGLEARWPGMRDRLCDTTPRIRQHLSVFCDGERVHLDTPLRPGAKVYILTAMSGG
ncbi:MAG TPA: MoaD/ThiS family protein [Hyphomicrobiales bacterium]|nr:MoaD/ThiS family protein [Hyphomicrobiales bacterium]